MLYPRPKELRLGKRSPFATPMLVFCADAPSKRALFPLHEMLPEIECVSVDERCKATVVLSVVPGIFERAEMYELSARAGAVQVRAKDYRGLVNALATLTQLLQYENGVFTIPDVEISDYPDAAFRALMADPHSYVSPMEEMRAQILSMAKAKLNKLHMHLFDQKGMAYQSDVKIPIASENAYTKAELREIIEYAAQFGIDVIPEFDIPAHNFGLTDMYPNFKCKVKGENGEYIDASGWNMCLGNEECYILIDAVLAEIAEIFPYEYVHIGTDELDLRDLVDRSPLLISHTEECERCNAFFAPKGLSTLTERFYWFINRVYATLTSFGKRMMLWNDSIDISKAPPIPRDILIEFWRVAAEQRGPVEGCSMQRFLDEGFEVVNADFPNTYVEEYMEWSRLKKWDFRKDPADASARPDQVTGGEMCAWGGSKCPHLRYALYIALPAFGDRLWNCSTPIPDDRDATIGLTRAALGMDTPIGFDLFEHMKDVPLGTARFWKGNPFCEEADLPLIRRILAGLKHQSKDVRYLTQELLRLCKRAENIALGFESEEELAQKGIDA